MKIRSFPNQNSTFQVVLAQAWLFEISSFELAADFIRVFIQGFSPKFTVNQMKSFTKPGGVFSLP